MFKRFHSRIGYRLSLSYAAVLGLLLVLAWLMLDRMEGLSDAFGRLADEQLTTVALTADVGAQADVSARKLLLLISAPRDQRVPAYAEIRVAQARLDATMAALEMRLPAGNRQLAYQELDARLIEYRRAYRETVDLIEADDLAGARRTMAEDTEDTLNLLAHARDTLTRGEQQIARDQAAELLARLRRDRRVVLALCLAALVAGSFYAVAVTRSIVRPLRRAEAAARRFAAGEYEYRVTVTTHDEVGRVSCALNSLADAVSEREARILRLANTDAMTGLAQRPRFVAEAAEMLEASAAGSCAALLCFDIDRLKTINGILGFDAGDAVIRDAAERLVAVLGPKARVARLAGGTFAALVPVPDSGAARALALALQIEVEHQVRWRGQALDLSITTGMSMYPQQGLVVEPLLRQAEQALFEAKRLHAGFAAYAPSLEASRQSHLSLLSDLHDAIRHGQLRQFLQPKLTPGGELRGVEALVRWCHPQRGWVSPAEFVPFAERTGRIGQVTDWMLDRAVTTLARWQQEGIELKIAVNVSTHDIQDMSLPQRIARLLAEHRVDPSRLIVELTETGLMDSGEDPIAVLHSLRAIGVWLAIDDFGTGHSSLAYLQQLPVNELKVDRSFVREVNADTRRRELLGSIVRLGHSLGMTVTAEGAETEAELAVLSEAGCDQVQGFLFAKPMDGSAFEVWRRERPTRRAVVAEGTAAFASGGV